MWLENITVCIWIATFHLWLTEIEEAPDDKALRQVCITAADTTMEAGYTKPVATITMARKQELVRILMLHYTLLRNTAVLDQLKAGLSTLGFWMPWLRTPPSLKLSLYLDSNPLSLQVLCDGLRFCNYVMCPLIIIPRTTVKAWQRTFSSQTLEALRGARKKQPTCSFLICCMSAKVCVFKGTVLRGVLWMFLREGGGEGGILVFTSKLLYSFAHCRWSYPSADTWESTKFLH